MRLVSGKYTRYNMTKRAYETTEFEDGKFHQWGSEYEEFENGAAQYTVAIVEMSDGSIVTAMPSDIRFMTED